MKVRFSIFLVISVIAFACQTAKDDGVYPYYHLNRSSGSLAIGEYIDIPGISNDDIAAGFMPDPASLRVNNAGIYFSVSGDNLTWIYRLRIADSSPEWYVHKHESQLWGFQPLQWTNESPSGFSVLAWGMDKYGHINANNGLPSLFGDKIDARPDNILCVDRSTNASTWHISGSVIRRLRNDNSKQWEIIPNHIEPNAFHLVEPDDDGVDASIWLAAGSKLYKIIGSDLMLVADLSSGNGGFYEYVKKIRVVNNDVWAGTNTQLFRIIGGQPNLITTYEAPQTESGLGGEFAVDSKYVYTSDGKKIEYSTGKTFDLYPDISEVSIENQQELLKYVEMVADIKSAGSLEVSTDPLDRYIYCLTLKAKLLKIRK